jgi:hypothetical protein
MTTITLYRLFKPSYLNEPNKKLEWFTEDERTTVFEANDWGEYDRHIEIELPEGWEIAADNTGDKGIFNDSGDRIAFRSAKPWADEDNTIEAVLLHSTQPIPETLCTIKPL